MTPQSALVEYESVLIDSYYGFMRDFRLNNLAYKLDFYGVKDIARRQWLDMERIRKHHGITSISCNRLAGYLAYWVCKLRPISVVDRIEYTARKGSPYINELFAIYIACGLINAEQKERNLTGRVKIDDKPLDSLLYTLRYRVMSGDALSLYFDMVEKLAVSSP